MTVLVTKPINLDKLPSELQTAGIAVRGLTLSDGQLYAPDDKGVPQPLPDAAQPVVDVNATAYAADLQADQQDAARIASARPGAALITKLKDGTALTAAETQAVLRWLALRAFREARP